MQTKRNKPGPLSLIAAAVVLVSASSLLAWAPAQAQVLQQAKALPAGKAAKVARMDPGKAVGKGRSVKPAAPPAPLAAKNVALGADAVPTQPRVLLSDGCLDAKYGGWLSGELGAAGSEWQGRPEAMPSGAPALRGREPAGDAGSDAAADGAGDSSGQAGGGAFDAKVDAALGAAKDAAKDAARPPSVAAKPCVPFAAVRTPADRIESLAFVPSLLPTELAAVRRVMVVSRVDLGSPTTQWHDLGEGTDGQREVWMPAASVLAGEVAEQVPQRWQRDVSIIVRQMKKQSGASDAAWVRLVLHELGDVVRVAAVELVNEVTGQAIDSAIWLERADGPGGFVGARGGDYERVLWQSPVDYRRISRGVGAATVVVRKRVLAAPKTPGGKPRTVIRSFRTRGQHQGVDFAAPKGTPVVTVAEGTVVHAGRNGGYGNLVVVDHGGGITTYYAHLSAFGPGVHEGAKVERGQEIGQVGSTGKSTGPHLHYEIRRDGQYLDPADPAQSLPNWDLAAGEHESVLTRLLSLSLSRERAFARSTRPSTLAAAPLAPLAAAVE